MAHSRRAEKPYCDPPPCSLALLRVAVKVHVEEGEPETRELAELDTYSTQAAADGTFIIFSGAGALPQDGFGVCQSYLYDDGGREAQYLRR